MTVAKLERVQKSFVNKTVLKDISFDVKPGENVAILGLSGAGKTTLFRLLNTSIAPDKGEIYLWGRNPWKANKKDLRNMRSRIGSIYQEGALIPRLRAIDNAIIGEMGKWNKLKMLRSIVSPDYEAALEALKRVGISDKAYIRTDCLSGGERQRVAIARLLIQKPDLILADEPTSSLDPVNAKKVLDLLIKNAGKNATLIASFHQTSNIELFDRVIGIKNECVYLDTEPKNALHMLNDLYGDGEK